MTIESILIICFMMVILAVLWCTITIMFKKKESLESEIRYYKSLQDDLKRELERQKGITAEIEIRTQKEYNKIATLSPTDLFTYLSQIYSRILETKADQKISDRDYQAMDKLYAYSYAKLLEYLGQETRDAIAFYYGPTFIDQWTRLTYEILEKRGILNRVIRMDASYEDVVRTLQR